MSKSLSGASSVDLTVNSISFVDVTATNITASSQLQGTTLNVTSDAVITGNLALGSIPDVEEQILNSNILAGVGLEKVDGTGTDPDTINFIGGNINDVSIQTTGDIQCDDITCDEISSGNITSSGDLSCVNITNSGTITSTGSISSSANLSCVDLTGSGNLSCVNIVNSGTITSTGNITNNGLLNQNANVNIPDGIRLRFGDDRTFQIYHAGASGNSLIQHTDSNGQLYIDARNQLFLRTRDSSNSNTNHIKMDNTNQDTTIFYGGSQKLKTINTGIEITGVVDCDSITNSGSYTGVSGLFEQLSIQGTSSTNNVTITDTNTSSLNVVNHGYFIYQSINPSNGLKLQLTADGVVELVNTTNNMIGLKTSNTVNHLIANGVTGETELYNSNNLKLKTISTGIEITGDCDCDGLLVNGSIQQSGSSNTNTFFGDIIGVKSLQYADTEGNSGTLQNVKTKIDNLESTKQGNLTVGTGLALSSSNELTLTGGSGGSNVNSGVGITIDSSTENVNFTGGDIGSVSITTTGDITCDDITCDLISPATVSATGSVTAGNNLGCSNNLVVGGTITATGNISTSGTITTSGTFNCEICNVVNDLNIGDDLIVVDDVTIGGQMNISGHINASGNITIGNNLTVGSSSEFNENVLISQNKFFQLGHYNNFRIRDNSTRIELNSNRDLYIQPTNFLINSPVTFSQNISGFSTIAGGDSQIDGDLIIGAQFQSGTHTTNFKVFGESEFYDRMEILVNGSNGALTIDSGGSVTSSNGVVQITSNSSGKMVDGMSFRAFSDGNNIINFLNSSNVFRGRIQGKNSSEVRYKTSSDRRLKTNIQDMDSQLDNIMNLQCRKFDWLTGETDCRGFIAQEVHSIFPEMKDEFLNTTYCENQETIDEDCPCDDDHNELYYGLDYGEFTPYIIKAFQEYKTSTDALIANLTSRIEALENN